MHDKKQIEHIQGMVGDAVRDHSSGAVIFTNKDKYKKAKARKRIAAENRKKDAQIQDLRNRMNELTQTVDVLVRALQEKESGQS